MQLRPDRSDSYRPRILTAIAAMCLAGAAAGGPPIAAWDAIWRQAPGEWALADLTRVGPGGETYVTTRPQVGGGNGSGILKYAADGTLEWSVVREEVPNGSEGFTDLEVTAEGISLVGIGLSRLGETQTLLLNYAADGTLLWEASVVGPAIPGFLQPQLAIGPAGERVVATDDGNGTGVLIRYSATGAAIAATPLSFSGFGGVSALEVDSAGHAVLVVLNDFTTYSVQKYDAAGVQLWSRDEAGDGLALSEAFIGIDAADEIVITGSLEVVPDGVLQVVSRVWRLAPDGALLWTIDSDVDFAISQDLALDAESAAYIVRATTFPNSEIVRIDAGGAVSWTRTFAGADFGTSFQNVAVSTFGDVIVGALDVSGPSFFGVRLLRYDAGGALQWTERVAEDPGHGYFIGDLHAGAGGAVSLVGTKRAGGGFDEALTIYRQFGGCTGDLDGTNTVGFADLLLLISAWGPQTDHPADFNEDGSVGFVDLLALLMAWGPCA